ncbi:MAG: dUTP diphosphatase [Porticoccaceae bacterium]|nr:dUTP diphosphatase [Porticoccaceae bacterium]
MQQQLMVMLKLQNDMNSKVHPQWREQNFAWYRAIWVECAELLDHYGWKWWKQQRPDNDQIALELVDIWHFGLSLLLLKEDSVEQIAKNLEKDLLQPTVCGDFSLDLEEFTRYTLETKSFDTVRFARLMQGIEMNFTQLYAGYVGKNVLNFFRQDHGYQDGTYNKQWGGKEDNEHLVEIVAEMNISADTFKDDLYQRMLAVYKQLCD